MIDIATGPRREGRNAVKIAAVFIVSLSIVLFHATVVHLSYAQEKEKLASDITLYAARKEELASQYQSLQDFAAGLRQALQEETSKNQELARELSELTDQQVTVPAAPPASSVPPVQSPPPRITTAS